MDRMKTFLKYLILFVAFYILTDVLIGIALTNNYKEISCTKNDTGSYVTQVDIAKATNVSGYVQGKIKLDESAQNPEKYLQVDFYSKYGHCLGRKFVDLSSVQAGQEKDFKVNFELSNIATYEITTTNEVTNLSDVQLDMVSKGYLAIGIVGALIVLYYVI